MGVDERKEEKGGRTFHGGKGEEGSPWVDAPWVKEEEKKKKDIHHLLFTPFIIDANLDRP